ncbi:hypothetical protein SRHO_G00021150 [Serrasalmus rhombeus]
MPAWHPFRLPGLCGLRGTMCMLWLVTVIIVTIIFYANISYTDSMRKNNTVSYTDSPRENTSFLYTDNTTFFYTDNPEEIINCTDTPTTQDISESNTDSHKPKAFIIQKT